MFIAKMFRPLAMHSSTTLRANSHKCSPIIKSSIKKSKIFSTHSDFLAETDITFSSIGLSDGVTNAISSDFKFQRPSQIQEMSSMSILEGQDVVLAAETGSGKTIAYLAPIITKILKEKQLINEIEEDTENPYNKSSHKFAIILCPNADLCHQVYKVVKSFTNTVTGKQLITVEIIPKGMSKYEKRPDIYIGTPGCLLTTLLGMGKTIAGVWMRYAGYIVIDEVDMMITGLYGNLYRILEMLRNDERKKALIHIQDYLNLSDDDIKDFPKKFKRALLHGGLSGMLEMGYKPKEHQIEAFEAIKEYKIKDDLDKFGKPKWKKQYLFVGATIPSKGTKSVQKDILNLFPLAKMISTEKLHKPISSITHEWIEIKVEERMDKLHEVINKDESFKNKVTGKILVFTRSGTNAESTFNYLKQKNLNCVLFHSKLTKEERQASLTSFSNTIGIIMVSTDGTSRGIDIPNITHVIQCNFAASTIDFLHRTGRTGRAGLSGKVTSLITDDDRDLANAIKECMNEEQGSVEGAFSRNRSFRKKIRKYGKFVPRGSVVVPAADSILSNI